MGVTGLETAFAVLHTDLVLPGTIGLELLAERMTAGGEPFGIEAPRIEAGAPGEPRADRPEARVGRGRGRLREPLGQQLLRRPRRSPGGS